MRVAPVVCVGLVIALAGCGGSGDRPPLADRVGKPCVVQFRRGDGLGAGGGLPVSPTTNNINGAGVSVSGTLRAATGGWLVVEAGGTEYHIPHAAVLLVEFTK